MLKQILALIYSYVDFVEPFVMLLAVILYLVHFFFLDNRTKAPLIAIGTSLIAISLALTLVIIGNRFFM